MKQYPNLVLNWFEETNTKAYFIANMMVLIGIVLLIVVVIADPNDTLRVILTITAFAFIASRFLLGFFRDSTKKSGSILFFDDEIHLLQGKTIIQRFKLSDISRFKYKIEAYEGEIKAEDFQGGIDGGPTVTLRSGINNEITFVHNGLQHRYLFKLSTELSKERAIKFLAPFEKQIFNATLDALK